jgi:hypothetical protein
MNDLRTENLIKRINKTVLKDNRSQTPTKNEFKLNKK